MKAKFFRSLVLIVSLLIVVFLPGCNVKDPDDPVREIKFAGYPEFVLREDGFVLLEKHYGLQFDHVYELTYGLTHEALHAGGVDVAQGFATDGKINELDLISLDDDKGVFTAYHPAPVIRKEALARYPEIESILREIALRLDTDTMIYLNHMVDIEERTIKEVARSWLQKEGLISEIPETPYPNRNPVLIGSKEYVEHKLLGYITIIALENAGIPIEDHTDLGHTRDNRSALLEGTIHLYWEYTATAWSTIYEKEEVVACPEELYRQIVEKDREVGLLWLDYAPLNNTYTIMMRREHANEIGVTSISDLVRWVKQVQAEKY